MQFSENFTRVLASIPEIQRPKANHVEYLKIFASSLDDPLGLALIQQLDEVKKQLVSQLKIPAKEIEDIQVLNVIDSYIPLVQTLFESIKRSQEAVRLDSKLAFQWFGGIGATDTCFECVDLIFEVLMCTVTKSVLHSRVAMNMIASTPAGSLLPLAAAGEHLKLAMGVLNSMQAILPCWTATPEMKRPLELFEPVRKALVHIFSGLASKLAVIKAIQKEGGTAPILMSKLCIFVSTQMGGALTLLSGLAYVRDIDTDLLIRTAFDREIFAALAMYYFAEDAFAKQETGVAVGFCHLSLRKLSAQGAGKFDPFRPGLPNLSAKGYVHFLPIIEECTTKISTLCKSCERENNLIYFKPVPAPESLPELPTGVSIMDAIPYNICTQPIIPTFQYNPKRQPSVFEAIGDFFSAGERSRGASTRSGTIQGNVFVDSRSADAKEPSLGQHVALAPNSSSLDSASTSDLAIASSGSVIAPRGSGMSDHEYAFRLQQQYDAEYLRR